MRIPLLSFVWLAGLGACSSYSPTLGSAPFLCGSAAPLCPDGFACQTEDGTGRMVCVAASGGEIPDAKMGDCADDHNLEPNDDTAHAFQTNVDNPKMSLPLSGLAICPANDKDLYSVTLSKGTDGPPMAYESLEAQITYEAMGAPLQLSILNAGGGTIVNGGAVSGMDNTVKAAAEMVPNGQYYVEVYGPAAGLITTNNYNLTITVTGP